jgi:hypothetical protein
MCFMVLFGMLITLMLLQKVAQVEHFEHTFFK